MATLPTEMHKTFQNNPESILETRANFPRGLIQPPGSYRFGLDALVLAAYACTFIEKHLSVAELGSGCGASLLALGLAHPDISGTGFEQEAELVSAANQNAVLLGLEARINFILADISSLDSAFFYGYDLVLANPPWRKGRPPVSRLRRNALSMQTDTLAVFCACACKLLHNRGLFCIILPPSLLCELVWAIQSLQLGLRQIQPIASFRDNPAKRTLCLLQKDAASDPVLLPTLALQEQTAYGATWTEAARNFCPWAVNK